MYFRKDFSNRDFQNPAFKTFSPDSKLPKLKTNNKSTFRTIPIGKCIKGLVKKNLLFLFVSVQSASLFSFVGRYLMSFSFFTAWHISIILL